VRRNSHVLVQCIAVNTVFLLAIFKEGFGNISLQSADMSYPTNTLFIANGNFVS
jgi:hypothetical protein